MSYQFLLRLTTISHDATEGTHAGSHFNTGTSGAVTDNFFKGGVAVIMPRLWSGQRLNRYTLAVVTTIAAWLTACASIDIQSLPGSPTVTQAEVSRVVDGDTIVVKHLAGPPLPAQRIRLIGVNAPEITGRTEPYGKEAAGFVDRLLDGKVVWLEKDVSDIDRYQRALRYVWLAEPSQSPTLDEIRQHMVNAILVAEGYAQVATFPPDVKYVDLFLNWQQEAREAGRGLWSLAEASAPEILSVTTPVYLGETVTLVAKSTPGVECSITVTFKSGPSRAAGLEPKVTGTDGKVSWSWKVSANTIPGTWPVTIECGGEKTEGELEVRSS